ncbi:hypothetical protein KJ781_04165 [Patescibacteria group bacterium]|nr:hypothetical protein [Patescibacteria group bacterium]MBU1448688.1 hypothetical protein [Patescibacteria group bacterium]MBU2613341.1 hypothetical protein [Patescibacteria group bacterium]
MQKKNDIKQAQKNDTVIAIEVTYMSPEDVMGFIQTNGVTAQSLAQIVFDAMTDTVGIGVVSTDGLDIWTKNRLSIGNRFDGYFTNLIRPDREFIFVEATPGTAAFKGLDQTVKGIATVPDIKTKLPAVDLYTGSFTDARLDQHAYLPNGKHIIMNPTGRKGIENVRYIQKTNDLIGTVYDTRGVCQGIAIIPFGVVLKNPTIVLNPEAWTIIMTIPEGREIRSFGRPRVGRDRKIQLVANFKGGYERLLTIVKDKYLQASCTWGTEARTDRFFAGVLNGLDNIVWSTMPNDLGVEIVFETYQMTDEIGKAYLA